MKKFFITLQLVAFLPLTNSFAGEVKAAIEPTLALSRALEVVESETSKSKPIYMDSQQKWNLKFTIQTVTALIKQPAGVDAETENSVYILRDANCTTRAPGIEFVKAVTEQFPDGAEGHHVSLDLRTRISPVQRCYFSFYSTSETELRSVMDASIVGLEIELNSRGEVVTHRSTLNESKEIEDHELVYEIAKRIGKEKFISGGDDTETGNIRNQAAAVLEKALDRAARKK